jgi:ribosomal-protein-alanine N-acetyltransferase
MKMNDHPTLQCVPLLIEHAQLICTWRYSEPYDIYNWPSWLDMQASGFEFGDAQTRTEQYVAILNRHDGVLLGFAQLFPLLGVTRLGLGLHPAYCSKGIGPDFTRAIAQEARRRAPENEIDLEVLSWNIRAFRAYQKAGFVHMDTYEHSTPHGLAEFHCMVFDG